MSSVGYDLTNKVFNRLFVEGKCEYKKGKHSYWICKCECGKVKEVRTDKLISGNTKSCGCFSRFKLGQESLRKTHNLSHTPIYNLWLGIKNRCNNENSEDYKDYGERGIKIFEEWINSFEKFYDYIINNLGDKPSSEYSLDRINNDEGYIPNNIRWATILEQANNRRNNRILEYNGEKYTVMEWSRKVGINRLTITKRLKRGWSIEKALFTKKGE